MRHYLYAFVVALALTGGAIAYFASDVSAVAQPVRGTVNDCSSAAC